MFIQKIRIGLVYLNAYVFTFKNKKRTTGGEAGLFDENAVEFTRFACHKIKTFGII